MAMERKATLIYCPYGRDRPLWAALGYVKEGKKYIYFKHSDGCGDFIQYKREEVLILYGWHEDIPEQIKEFRNAERQYLEKREQYQKQLSSELNHLFLEKLNEWDKQNPPPKFNLKPPNFLFSE
jgi:hypothetical protein